MVKNGLIESPQRPTIFVILKGLKNGCLVTVVGNLVNVAAITTMTTLMTSVGIVGMSVLENTQK
jgi:hypothetical protein